MFYFIEILDVHPFQDPYKFFYRDAMVNFHAYTRFSHWPIAVREIPKSYPRLSIYNKIFQNCFINWTVKSFIRVLSVWDLRPTDLYLSLKNKRKEAYHINGKFSKTIFKCFDMFKPSNQSDK